MSLYWARSRRKTVRDVIRFGKSGEKVASAFLRRKGYRILERNFSCFLGEVDIVAEDADTVVFIEVKSRRSVSCAFPEEAVDRKKRQKIIKIADFYMDHKRLIGRDVRFDVVAIDNGGNTKGLRIRLIQDAFGEE